MQWTYEHYKYYSAEHLQKAEKHRFWEQVKREAATMCHKVTRRRRESRWA